MATSVTLTQKTRAMLSGSLRHGAFPWEKNALNEAAIKKEYGERGVGFLRDFRKASEKGVAALSKFRQDKLPSFEKALPEDAGAINRRLERQQATLQQIKEQYGNRGVEALQAYRKLHYYEPASVAGARYVKPKEEDIRSFSAKKEGDVVVYSRGSDPAFTDRGATIHIHQGQDKEAVLAALRLAASKWESFMVDGTPEYKRLCTELAAEHGFKLSNPELRAEISKAGTIQPPEQAHQPEVADKELRAHIHNMLASGKATPEQMIEMVKEWNADGQKDPGQYASTLVKEEAAKLDNAQQKSNEAASKEQPDKGSPEVHWMNVVGGVGALNAEQKAKAEESFKEWKQENPTKDFDLKQYVSYVQSRRSEERQTRDSGPESSPER